MKGETKVSYLEGDALEKSTAEKLTKLAALRGHVGVKIEFQGGQYIANGEVCGRSVHGVYAWLDKKEGRS